MVHEVVYAGVMQTCPPVVHHLINPARIEEITDELMIILTALPTTANVEIND